MQSVTNFWVWFFTQIPSFLMSEPICYFMGIAIAICVVRLFVYIKNVV